MQASDLMTEQVYYVNPSESVARVKNLFLKHKISTVLVMEEDKPVGMLGEPEVAGAFYNSREPVDQVRVKEVMNNKIVTILPNAAPEEASKKLLEEKVKGVIVFDEDQGVMGIITKTDLIPYFIEKYTGKALVSDVMDTNVRTVKPKHSLFHAIRTMQEEGISRIIVVEDGLQGIISLKDVALTSAKDKPTKLIFTKDSRPGEREVRMLPFTVEEIMKTEVHKIRPSMAATKAAKIMLEKKIGSLVVVDSKGKIQGMLTKTDFAKHLLSTT
ncbi:CBS domain-containing protein [archaeon]|nr:CBS domain-containing protein [archaeon]